jgi:hypothetical protein
VSRLAAEPSCHPAARRPGRADREDRRGVRGQPYGDTVEQRVGGRVYETWQGGTVVEWGTLLVWQPSHRFTVTWTSTPVPTEVELAFTALGPALTRVAVEHRGWESLSEAQLSEDCALPDGCTGGGYSSGWTTILARFAAAAEAPRSQPGGWR